MQMEPLGDRILIKPEEEKSVSIPAPSSLVQPLSRWQSLQRKTACSFADGLLSLTSLHMACR